MKEIFKNIIIVACLLFIAGVEIYYIAELMVENRLIEDEAAFCRNANKHGLNVPTCKAPNYGVKGSAFCVL